MTTLRFSVEKEGLFYKQRAAEKARLYYPPLRWLVNDDTIELNIYGEPGLPLSGTDGATSSPATRQFTSSGSDFSSEGVQAGDILVIETPACNDGDNGRYQVSSIVSSTILEISEDWPEGNLSSLVFNVHFLKQRYTEWDYKVPVMVKLQPTQKELDRWGIQERRDAMIVLSIRVCEDIELTPKIGDRFIHPYGSRDIHYEVKNLFEDMQLTNTAVPINYVGFAMRTTNKLP